MERGVSGELDPGLLSQVSGCYRVASALALWLTMSTSTSFFTLGTLETEQASTRIWKKGGRKSIGEFKKVKVRHQQSLYIMQDPGIKMLKCVCDFALDLRFFSQLGASPPSWICSQSTSTQVEVKPTSQRDATKTLFLLKTKSEQSLSLPSQTGWLISHWMALNCCFPHYVVNSTFHHGS